MAFAVFLSLIFADNDPAVHAKTGAKCRKRVVFETDKEKQKLLEAVRADTTPQLLWLHFWRCWQDCAGWASEYLIESILN